MRILHVGKYYPPVKGGMETVLREMAEGLLARGHRVSVLVAASDGLDREETLAVTALGLSRKAVTMPRPGMRMTLAQSPMGSSSGAA